jgi:hypothetical protein
VDFSLKTLVGQFDDDLFERASVAYRAASGLGSEPPRARPCPELQNPELFIALGERLGSPRLDAQERGRLLLLRRFVARGFADARAGSAQAHLDGLLDSKTFLGGGHSLTIRAAQRAIPRESSSELRGAIEAGLNQALLEEQGAWARRVDALVQAAHELQLSLTALVEFIQGRPLGSRVDATLPFLRHSEAAARDVLAYALRHIDSGLTVKVARHHDVQRAAWAPSLESVFRKEDLPHAITRCIGDLGLDLGVQSRLTVDTETRTGKSPEPRVFELRVPNQIRLVLTPAAGLPSYAGWLDAWGTALHRSHVNAVLPFVERRAGDPTIIRAFGQLFSSFLTDEEWLGRYLRLSSAQARDAARLAALSQLLERRRLCALAWCVRSLLERGPVPPLMDEYGERMADAWFGEAPRARLWLDVEPFGEALLELDAWRLSQSLRAHLRESFNEDYWRNPATGRWLLGLATRGQDADAFELCTELRLEPPSLQACADETIGVLGR